MIGPSLTTGQSHEAARDTGRLPPVEAFSELTALVATAVALGRIPGEPAHVLKVQRQPGLLARLFHKQAHSPLADPRLEVMRAISASLSRGMAQIGEELVAAAHRAGWSSDDLRQTFPGVPVRLPR